MDEPVTSRWSDAHLQRLLPKYRDHLIRAGEDPTDAASSLQAVADFVQWLDHRAERPATESEFAATLLTALPFPIAEPLADYEAARHDQYRRYKRLLDVGKALITVTGVVGLVWLRDAGRQVPSMREWSQKVQRNGVSLGHWLAVGRDAAREAWRVHDPYMDMGRAWRRGRLEEGLSRLLKARNEEGHGVQARTREASERLTKLRSVLASATAACRYLASAEWLLVEESRPRDDDTWSVTARVLKGSGRVWPTQSLDSQLELLPGGLYVRDSASGRLTEMSPFAAVRTCSNHGTDDVYFPDRYEGSALRMTSTSHPDPFFDEELGKDLRGVLSRLGGV